VLAAVMIQFGFAAAIEAISQFLPAFGELERGFSAVVSGRLLACYWFGLIVGRAISASVTHRDNERGQLIAGTVLGAALLLAALVSSQWLIVAAAVFLAGVAAGPTSPLAFSFAARHAGDQKVGAIGASQVFGCVGVALGPIIVGVLGDVRSLHSGLLMVFALFMATAVPMLAVRPRSRPDCR
jgi:fucose permease